MGEALPLSEFEELLEDLKNRSLAERMVNESNGKRA